MTKKLPQLTDGDKAIFARALETDNPSWITNFYLRNNDSGTYWRVVTPKQLSQLELPESIAVANRWKTSYEQLVDTWTSLKSPDYFGVIDNDWQKLNYDTFKTHTEQLDRVYRVFFDPGSNVPIFHYPHGIQFIPWQLQMHQSRHPIQVIVGGFGSAKTFGKALSMMTRAITLPGYRALALAPFSKQAQEVHTIMLQIIQGTIFEKFLLAHPTKPYPQLIFGNTHVGTTSIECFSCDDPDKFLTLTVDEALVDQAEQVDGNGTATIEELVRALATRFRGTVRGRSRVGQITLSANSGDNPQLWDLYDEGATDPDYVLALSPKTHENVYLTVDDLVRYERVVGRDDTSRRMYLFGERPIGSGEHFPQESLEKCRARWLDERMSEALKQKTPGWMKLEERRVAVYRWQMPPEEGHRYIVAADAGWADPPDRNAAVIGVWDITSFPTTPATLVAFHWVHGGGSPNPWIAQYLEYVQTYKAIGLNGYDSTGTGAGYERMEVISDVLPTPINLGGMNKMVYLNLTKKLMADGKLQMPSITHLFSQCAKYSLPDDRLRQDIVMMLLITSALMEIFSLYSTPESDDDSDYDPNDRYYRQRSNRDDGFFMRTAR